MQGERVLHHLPLRLGRNALNDCPLAHPFVSDFHASLEISDGELCVRDLNSRNGLFDLHGARLPAGQGVPLRALGGTFVVGLGVEVEVTPFEDQRGVGERLPSSVHGSVLGNRAALAGAASVPPLPALSLAQPGAVGPPLQPPPYVPAVGLMSGAGPSLPPLVPLGGPSVEPNFGASLPGLAPVRPASPVGGMAGWAPPPPDPENAQRSTQHLPMSMEVLALMGLKELAASLVPNVPLETTGEVARLLTKMHDLIEVVCRCLPALRDARPAKARWKRGANNSRTALLVETSGTPAELAKALLDWRAHEYDGTEAVERIMVDVIAQQTALVDTMMAGIQSLFDELSPERIERATREDGGAAGMFGRHRALWQAFEERFRSLNDEDRRAEMLLGPEGAAAYRQRQARPRTG
jgi:type VI secretion system protein ImpI